jgi:hypothetical protein
LIFLSQATLHAQTIQVTGLSTTSVCAGSDVTVTFVTTNGNGNGRNYNINTVYTIYLSNSSGGGLTQLGSTFRTPSVTYGTKNGDTVFSKLTIPLATVAGSDIRLGEQSDFDTSGGAGASGSFQIKAFPSAAGTITGSATVCQSAVSYSVPAITDANSIFGYTGTDYDYRNDKQLVTFASNATLSVTGNNICSNGTVSANYAIAVNLLPSAAGTIIRAATVCQRLIWRFYSVPGEYDFLYLGMFEVTVDGSTNQ